MTDKNSLYRYPGTKPFSAEEYDLFKGRNEDINNLYKLVSLQNLVVLFGRSGLGKSSLLNAGLVNRFRDGLSTVPLFFRFGSYYDKSPVSPFRKTYDIVKSELHTTGTNFIYDKLVAEKDIIEHQLWNAFKSYQIVNPGKHQFVLIFDQFEELFTYSRLEIELFKKELAALLYVSVPQQLRNLLKDKLRSDANYLSVEEKELLFTPLIIKVLFSIRSDKLSLLNNLTDYLPSVLKWCYELKPLQAHQARQAIEEPARLEDEKYVTPTFNFTDEATTLLLASLTAAKPGREGDSTEHKPEIETFQLQIVCKHAENLVMEKGLRQITAADFGNIKEIFENHYRNIIAKISPADQLPARRLIEEKLIVDNNRVSMPIPVILKDRGMTNALLDELIGTHILRREQNNTVELSHDTLIEPVLKYYEERKKEEAVIAELAEKEEQIKRIEKEQEINTQKLKASRNRLLVSIVSVALVLTLGLAGYALFKSRVANEQRAVATLQQQIAIHEANKAHQSAEKAMAAQKDAEMQRRKADSISIIAVAERNRANIFADQALTAKQAIEVQAIQTTKIKEAFRLNALAREWVDVRDPTIALRIEEAALHEFPDPMIVNAAQQIFKQQGFYKIVTDKIPDPDVLYFSPNGTDILTNDGLRSMKDQKLRKFSEQTRSIRSVAFSANGTKMLTGSDDDTVRLWNNDGLLLKKFPIQSENPRKKEGGSRIPSVAFSPDETKIFAGFMGYGAANLWDITGKLLWKMEETPGSIIRFGAFSPDNESIFTGPIEGKVGIWNIREHTIGKEFKEMQNTDFAVFSPGGDKILTDRGLWDTTGRKIWQFAGKGYDVCSGVFSRNGELVVTRVCNGTTAILWDARTGNIMQEFNGHTEAINAVAFSSDGQFVLTGSKDGSIRAWPVNGAFLNEFHIPVSWNVANSMALSVDGQKILTGSGTNSVKLWNRSGSVEKEFKIQNDTINCEAFSPDGLNFFAGCSSGIGRIWSIKGIMTKEINLQKEGGAITAVAFSPDGAKLLTGSEDGKVRIWNTNGIKLAALNGLGGEYDIITSIAMSPDEASLLVGTLPISYRNTAERILLYSADGTKRRELGKGSSAAFSADGKKVIIGSRRFPNLARALTTEGLVLCQWEYTGEVISVTFSADDAKIFMGTATGSVRVYARPPSLEEVLQSDKLHKLTPAQKKLFGIR